MTQKEKAYDEALALMQDCIPDKDGYVHVRPCDIFSELKENEDEEIRQAMINFFKSERIKDGIAVFHFGVNIEKMIAWLEKQGKKEQDERYEHLEELLAADDIYQMSMNDAMVNEAKEKAAKALSELSIGKLLGFEKQGEQKPDVKVEANFKVGDWLVENGVNGNVVQITEFEEDKEVGIRVWFSNGTGTYIDFLKYYHLWTIADAKDGDVLTWDDSKCIALFKNIYDEDSFNSHGFVGHCSSVFESRLSYHDTEGAHPATKEQRELLFSKMKEAGYEWNETKKELKKISQHELTEFEDAVKDMMNAYRDAIGESDATIEEIKKHADYLLSLIHHQIIWKPSDEQIYWLKWAINRMPDTEKANEAEAVLEELLEQLKKAQKAFPILSNSSKVGKNEIKWTEEDNLKGATDIKMDWLKQQKLG